MSATSDGWLSDLGTVAEDVSQIAGEVDDVLDGSDVGDFAGDVEQGAEDFGTGVEGAQEQLAQERALEAFPGGGLGLAIAAAGLTFLATR